MWRTEAYDEPVIFYDTVDGWREKAGCENVSQLEDELYIYHYTLEAWDPEGECYAFFDGYNGNVHCEVKVPLTMQLGDAPSVELSYLPMEQSFLWNDGACTVVGAEILEDGSMTEVQVAVVQDESFDDPTLCYISEFDGMEYTAYCEDCQDLGSGMFSYGFYVLDRMPGSDCWACFSGDNDGAPYEVRVLLENTAASEEGAVERGDWFTLGGEEVIVQDVVLEEKGNTLNLQVFVERDDRFGTMPILCYVTTDGQRETAECQSYIAREDGNVSYRYKVKNVDTDRGMSLRFTDSLGLTPAVTVPLAQTPDEDAETPRLGEWVPFGSSDVIVYSCDLTEVGSVTQVELEVEYGDGDLGVWPMFCYTTTDGEEVWAEARYVFESGCATFLYQAMDMDPEALYYASFEEEFAPYDTVQIALN